MRSLLVFFIFSPSLFFGQITGVINHSQTNEPLFGVKIQLSTGQKTLSDANGKFSIVASTYPTQLSYSLIGFVSDSINVFGDTLIKIKMSEVVQEITTVVVSASRFDQNIEDVPVSMEIIRPALIDNKGLANLEQAVDQSPGVYAMDGQVSIRGGGGYAYGAGSRVLVLWNGIPMTSPDVGDAKWNSIPMEQSSQIEIMKGASSVLYGSGALNGIISLTEREPGTKLEVRAKVQTGFYDNPRRSQLKWWDKTQSLQMTDAYIGKQIGNLGLTFGLAGFRDEGYKQGEKELRARVNGSVYYRFKKHKIKTGLSYNFQYQDIGVFVLWKADTMALIPRDGTLSLQKSIRLNVDPYFKYIDKKNNKHNLRTRYYLVSQGNSTYVYASSKAEMYFVDYQFQKDWKEKGSLTLGLTNSNNVIHSSVFGYHFSENAAAYGQIERKYKRLDLTTGLRFEYFKQDTLDVDSEIKIGKTTFPIFPVFRTGAHYQLAKYTHFRASFGQGVRFPSVAERYVATELGGLVIFPNPRLNPERGWSAETGIKQVVKMGEWKGMIDMVGFINEYSNMIEFTFGIYNPHTFEQLDPANNEEDLATFIELLDEGFETDQLVGFQAQNAERARITGLELSFSSMGKIKEVDVVTLIGYTYMNPISLNTDPSYVSNYSDSGSNLLKYRFKHLVKADVELTYKNFSFGFSTRYNSFMKNIDKVFEADVIGNGTYFLPGLAEYRLLNNRGSFVVDLRVGYKFKQNYRIGFMVNNLLNAEYTSRPGDIQPPRTFLVQFQYQIR